jgi:hypothetical protein
MYPPDGPRGLHISVITDAWINPQKLCPGHHGSQRPVVGVADVNSLSLYGATDAGEAWRYARHVLYGKDDRCTFASTRKQPPPRRRRALSPADPGQGGAPLGPRARLARLPGSRPRPHTRCARRARHRRVATGLGGREQRLRAGQCACAVCDLWPAKISALVVVGTTAFSFPVGDEIGTPHGSGVTVAERF